MIHNVGLPYRLPRSPVPDIVRKIGDSLKNTLYRTPGMIRRPMVAVPHPIPDDPRIQGSPSFSIFQMNTLANVLSKKDFFPDTDPKALRWSHRKSLLKPILLEHPYDIICLQEVDKYGEFCDLLNEAGFVGLHEPKVVHPDGCALFFKKDRFKLLDWERVVLKDERGSKSSNPERFWSRNVAILARLALVKNENYQVIVSTTHLKASLAHKGLRLKQGRKLLQKLEHFTLKSINSMPNAKSCIVVTGDFNDTPGSPVVTLYNQGEHLFSLKSAYPTEEQNYHKRQPIDYIWYDSADLHLSHILMPPRSDQLPHTLPAINYPSDHFALAANFVWKKFQ